ncbi:MAG: C40 family peptidase, partial [Candidatus Krumholzibacteriota bacterium]|nr:C40 family peptidase [Candidatus Krumholzibacteriota bacterium]
ASVADLRREADHSSELLSQSIMGEKMTVLQRQGDWYYARMTDNYHGWVRSWHVSETPPDEVERYMSRVNAQIDINVGYVLSAPDPRSLPVSDIVAGTLVRRRKGEGGMIGLELPGGREGYIAAGAVGELYRDSPRRDRLLDRVKRFAGIPYLWGGTSPKGFDCSGLVKRVFLMVGVELPRDSDQQAKRGEPIPREKVDEVRPGDLLFFGEGGQVTHVAIGLGGGRFYHAFGDVRVNSYLEKDPRYEEKLARSLLFGRVIIKS